jgi:hypothetical protein
VRPISDSRTIRWLPTRETKDALNDNRYAICRHLGLIV